MTDPSLAVQVGLYQLLSTALDCPVYDHVPEDARPPYVVIDYEVASNADLLSQRMDSRLLYLSVWSDYPGQAEVKRLMAAIGGALHGQRLTIPSGRATQISIQRTSTNREPDGRTYQGQVVLRLLTPH